MKYPPVTKNNFFGMALMIIGLIILLHALGNTLLIILSLALIGYGSLISGLYSKLMNAVKKLKNYSKKK